MEDIEKRSASIQVSNDSQIGLSGWRYDVFGLLLIHTGKFLDYQYANIAWMNRLFFVQIRLNGTRSISFYGETAKQLFYLEPNESPKSTGSTVANRSVWTRDLRIRQASCAVDDDPSNVSSWSSLFSSNDSINGFESYLSTRGARSTYLQMFSPLETHFSTLSQLGFLFKSSGTYRMMFSSSLKIMKLFHRSNSFSSTNAFLSHNDFVLWKARIHKQVSDCILSRRLSGISQDKSGGDRKSYPNAIPYRLAFFLRENSWQLFVCSWLSSEHRKSDDDWVPGWKGRFKPFLKSKNFKH